MIKTLTNQTIALAGLTQAIHLVQQIAKTGSVDTEAMEASLSSVLRINAEDVEDVYSGLVNIKPGLQLLVKQLGTPDQIDPILGRYAATLIFLEGKLRQNPPMQERIQQGIGNATAQAAHFGVTHENVIANLADLYQNTISQLRPRVMVMGEPVHLTNPANANKIRALLMAGLRSAVLWRQCGGRRWRLIVYRGKMQDEARRLLKGL